MADALQLHKYVVKNTAKRAGKAATFLPKPIFEENGSGMHVHQSLWKDGETLMHAADGYALLSPLALHYAAGLLEHAPALMAFCAPTTNSYRRLVPGYEAPVLLKHSQRNRSAAVRIPMYSASPKTKRLEFRPPDPLANPYLALPAMLMAGLDGIERELDPGEPMDTNLYELPPERARGHPDRPGDARRGARRARGRPRLPHARRGVHRRPDQRVRRVPARPVRPGEDPAAPLRVPDVLRRLASAMAAASSAGSADDAGRRGTP